MNQPRTSHLAALDVLKGIAIVLVVLIHCRALEGTFLFLPVVNRAVSLFLILFGVTSELWWKRRVAVGFGAALGEWYSTRWERLMPGVWATAVLWWLLVMAVPLPRDHALGPAQFVASFVGYSPWRGVTWFVTVVLQCVLVFPFARWVALRIGVVASVLVAACMSALSIWHLWDIVAVGKEWLGSVVDADGFPYFWMFLPRVAWWITCGWALARVSGGKVSGGGRGAAVAAVVWVAAVAAVPLLHGAEDDKLGRSLREQILSAGADVPLAILLLWISGVLVRWPWVARPLVHLGSATWGIYLGHVLLHDAVHRFFGWPEKGSLPLRFAYGAFLLAGGLALAHLGTWLQLRWQRRVASLSSS